MAIVGRQSLSKSSPARSSHNFSTREQDNQQQQQQTSSSSSSSSLQGLSSRPPTTRKRSAPRTPDKLVRRRPSVPVFVGPKTTPMKQLNEMARSQVGIYGEERKELLQAFEETRTTNIMMESESPQQAEAAPAPSTEQPQEKLLPLPTTPAREELLHEWSTPIGYVEPSRKGETLQFVDREYEKRVREQYHAIKKAIPYWVAHELQRPIISQSEADRVASKHRTFLEEAAKERNINRFSYEAFMRVRAEEQVRWGGTPKKALQMMIDAVELDADGRRRMIKMLDSPRRKKQKN